MNDLERRVRDSQSWVATHLFKAFEDTPIVSLIFVWGGGGDCSWLVWAFGWFLCWFSYVSMERRCHDRTASDTWSTRTKEFHIGKVHVVWLINKPPLMYPPGNTGFLTIDLPLQLCCNKLVEKSWSCFRTSPQTYFGQNIGCFVRSRNVCLALLIDFMHDWCVNSHSG